MKHSILALTSLLALAGCTQQASAPPEGGPRVAGASEIEIGAYIADMGGCHDCHTPGWAQNNGQAPAELLMTGVPVGFSGPWGTSYAANLRLSVAATTREEWVADMQVRGGLPPMPWWTLNRMDTDDLGALYAYIESLGESGEPIPAALPPGVVPETPFIWFDPVGPDQYPAAPAE